MFHARLSGNLLHLNSRENRRKASRPVWPGFSLFKPMGTTKGVASMNELWIVLCHSQIRYIFLTSCFVILSNLKSTFFISSSDLITLGTELSKWTARKRFKKDLDLFSGFGNDKNLFVAAHHHPRPPPPHPLTHRRALRIGKRKNWFQVTRTTTKLVSHPISMEKPQSTHKVAMAEIWRTFHHDGKICPGWWGGRRCTPTPFHSITIAYKVALPVFHLYPYMYSVEKPASFLTICERKLV
jgi:hypothetical protein